MIKIKNRYNVFIKRLQVKLIINFLDKNDTQIV